MSTLLLHVIIPIIGAMLLNGLIFGMRWNTSSKSIPMLPPGYVIAFVWIVILGLLGALHYFLWSQRNYVSWVVVFVIIFCLAYPFMTLGLKQSKTAAILNLVTLFLSFLLCFSTPNNLKIYTFPLIAWASYVNLAQTIYPLC